MGVKESLGEMNTEYRVQRRYIDAIPNGRRASIGEVTQSMYDAVVAMHNTITKIVDVINAATVEELAR